MKSFIKKETPEKPDQTEILSKWFETEMRLAGIFLDSPMNRYKKFQKIIKVIVDRY